MKKYNRLFVILTVVILAIFAAFYYYSSKKAEAKEQELKVIAEKYEEEARKEQAQKEAQKAKLDEIKKSIPGVVCWGDDMTYGKGGVNSSYPYELERLLSKNGYDLPVYNNGVSGENSLTVLGRVGAIPYVVEAFNLESSPDLIEIKVKSSYDGSEVNPLLRKRNPGVNPCSIDGVNGTLYGYVNPADRSRVDQFYFVRNNTGESKNVQNNTQIVTNGNTYKDYINILAIGDNGGFSDADDLVNQYNKFVNYLKGSKNENSYLVIGRYKGNKKDNKYLDSLMSDEFGEHFVNVREYLCTSAIKDMGITPTDEDLKSMEIGEVPPSFKNNEGYLNDKAYKAIGKLIYNKLVKNNYIKK